MKIKVILIRLLAKIQSFLRNQYGRIKPAERILKAIFAGLLATNVYFYITDLGVPLIAAFIGSSVVLYIIISICFFILKILTIFINRIKTSNLVMLCIGIFVCYKFIDDVADEMDWSQFEEILAAFVSALILMIFAKSISASKNKKVLPIVTMLLTTVVVGLTSIFIIYPGVENKPDFENVADKTIEENIIYSAEYKDYQGDSVNLRPYVKYSGKTKWVRDKYFSKTLSEVPIKGRLWYPEGATNVPLVILAHGNHRFTTPSYKGYDYLGKQLARQGIAMASVDMNMLNGFSKFGLKNENDARAYLLLENLEYLIKNSETKTEFENLFDKNQIAFIGHSRGGEAASIAAELLNLKYNPDNGEKIKYDFKTKAVVAIAPTVDQYNFANKDLKLKGLNFLTIHGTHDSDVDGFEGMKLYNNTSLDDGRFKSAIYLGNANHGKFNSEWKMDTDPPKSWFLNRASLLKSEDQQNIASFLIGEFLKASFFNTGDLNLIKNPEEYKEISTPVWSRYQNASFDVIANFDEDYDLTTFSHGKTRFDKLSVTEESTYIGDFDTEDNSLVISGSGEYIFSFVDYVPVKKYLSLDVMINDKEENYSGMDLEIELVDDFGNAKSVKLEDYAKLQPKIKVEISKFQQFTENYDYNSSFKTVKIPMEVFNIDRDKIKYIKLKANDVDISLDNLGYSE